MDDWERLMQGMRTSLADLYGPDTKVVVGRGGRHPRIVFVGEAPGAEEDRQGLPFVGRSGQLLENWIQYLGLGKDQYYITNVVRCRPPDNRDPTKDEVRRCAPFLDKQLALLEPKVIVCLGRFAMQHFLPHAKSILRESGKLQQGRYYVVPHPSYFLRLGGTGWEPYLEQLRRILGGEKSGETQEKLF